MQKQGKWVGGKTPLGYIKDSNDKNKLIIYEPEAQIVKNIFDMAFAGEQVGVIRDYLNNVTNLRIINNNEAEANAIDNQDNLMLINATIEEIHDDYLMVSCTNSPKMIKVIYSKNNLSNFKEKQKIAIFFASTNTSTLSGVRIKILE